ncbi:MAG: enoyl-CoA hydratase/isomerase family protein [Candidatus Methanofastidiosia archaeon]
MYKNILLEFKEKTAILTINRPEKLNAMDLKTISEIEKAIQELEEKGTGVLIITGKGKAFVAGADIKEMSSYDPIKALEFAKAGQKTLELIENSKMVVIAAINGFALGGGCELALACDLRIAGDDAKLGQPEINLGVIPGWGGTQRLSRLVGKAKAKELIFTGKKVNAQKALEMGLVNRVVPSEKLMEEALKLSDELKTKGFTSLLAAKKVINLGSNSDFKIAQDLEAESFALLFSTYDQKEGMRAFLEKRKPKFNGGE